MQSEHAHNDLNYAQGYEPRISSKPLLQKLATVALKGVPGATKLIEEHFSTAQVKDPHKLFPVRPRNQAMHLGW